MRKINMKIRVATVSLAMVAIIAVLASCSSNESGGGATEFPSEDITMLVPFSAGGSTDALSRALASSFEEEFDQTVVVENIPGGSGAQAMNELRASEPDGHTVMIQSNGPGIILPIVEDVGYTKDDYLTLGRAALPSLILAVPGDSPYGSLEELLAAAEERPGEISVGVPGAETGQTVALQRIAEAEDVEFNIIPFDGGTESANALLGGNIDASLNPDAEVVSSIESGDLRGLATTRSERSNWLPDVPTFEEQGIESTSEEEFFFGLAASENTPPEIVQQWENALESTIDNPETRNTFEDIYLEPSFENSEEFRQSINEIHDVYEPILTED